MSDRMAEWSGADRKKKPVKRNWRRHGEKAIEEARERLKAGGPWEYPRHLAALYCLLHEHTYGVLPLDAIEVFGGVQSAAGKLAGELGGVEQGVAFLRWCWGRERAREKRRGPGGGSRIGWYLQFVRRDLLVDYKVELARGARANGKGAGT